MKKLFLTCAALALAPGCMNMQRVIINTSTPGAQITMVKRGEIQKHNTVAGVVDVDMLEQFEEKPVVIGTSPMVYDFQRVQDGFGWGVGDLFWQDQTRVCRSLEIRATTSSGQSAMEVVPVNGADVSVFIQMSPPPAPPAHAATSVPQPRS